MSHKISPQQPSKSLPFYSEQRSPSYKSYTSTWPVGLKLFSSDMCHEKAMYADKLTWFHLPCVVRSLSISSTSTQQGLFFKIWSWDVSEKQKAANTKTWYLQRMTAVSYNFFIVSWVDDIWLLSWSQYVLRKPPHWKDCENKNLHPSIFRKTPANMPRAANRSTFETIETWSYVVDSLSTYPTHHPPPLFSRAQPASSGFILATKRLAHAHDVTACMPLVRHQVVPRPPL